MKKILNLNAVVLCFTLFIPYVAKAQVQWEENGIQTASYTITNTNQKAIADGHGGFFLVWEDTPDGDSDIYAQWVDASSTKRWGSSGRVVSGASANQKKPALALDGAGGLYVAWHDELSGDVLGQHIDATGTLLGPAGGFAICDASGVQSDIQLVSDGAGGVIAAWKDTRNSSTDIYAQRIGPDRQRLWALTGVAISTADGTQSFFTLNADLAGGAYAVWQDGRDADDDIYAQRIHADGTVQWALDGRAICTAVDRQESPSADVNSTGLVITWTDHRSGVPDIYAQLLNGDGDALWTADGLAVCTADGHQIRSRVLTHDTDTYFIAWSDFRDGYDIFAQKINGSGEIQWPSTGLSVTESTGLCYYQEMALDGEGGLWLMWNDNLLDADPLGNGINLFYQHLNGSGEKTLAGNGEALVNMDGTQDAPIMFSDGSTGFIALWQDARSTAGGIYAQHVNDAITLKTPASNALIGGNIETAITWTLPTSGTLFNTLSLHLSRNGGSTFDEVITHSVNPDAGSYTWTPGGATSPQAMIQLRAYNAQGLASAEFTGYLFNLDTTAPDAFDLLQPGSAEMTGITPRFRWRQSADAQSSPVSYTLYLNGSVLAANLTDTSYTTVTPLTSGDYTWHVEANDQAGQVTASTQTWQFSASEDHDPPEAFTVTGPSQGYWTRDTEITFKWNATSDAHSGLAGYRLVIDGQPKAHVNASTTQHTVSGLTQGRHSWYVEASDSVDNIRQSDTRTFSIDAVPPQAFTLTTPTNGTWTHDTTPALTWAATQDTGIGLSHYNLYLDNTLLGDHLPLSTTTFTVNALQPLSEGDHVWRVEAVDQLGNVQNAAEAFTLRIDAQPPASFSLTSPEPEAVLATVTPALSWTPSSDTGSGLKEYQLLLDGQAHGAPTTQNAVSLWPAVTEGEHHWQVRAEDHAGNITLSDTQTFTADTTAPAAFTLFSPAEGSRLNALRPVFKWAQASDAISGFNRFELFVDGQQVGGAHAADDTVSTLNFDLDNGNHYWKVIAHDNVGNQRVSSYVNFMINAHAPTITSPEQAQATEDMPFTYTATAMDENDEPVQILFESVPAWCTVQGAVISGTPPNGALSTTFDIVARDTLFTVRQTVSLALTAVNDQPAITAITDLSIPEDGAITALPFSVYDEETSPGSLLLTVASSDTQLVSEQGIEILGEDENRTLNITPKANQHGQSTITINLSDGVHQKSIHFVLTVTPVNDTPRLTPLANLQIDEDGAKTGILLHYGDIETAANDLGLSFLIGDESLIAPEGIQFIAGDTPSLNLTPLPNAHGSTSITVTVSDAEADSSCTFTFTVNPVNDKPVITSPALINGTEEVALSYTATAEDVDGTTLSFTFPGLPQWMHANGAKLTGTPPEGVTEGQFSLVASDGELSDTLTLELKIEAVNDAPCFTTELPTVEVEGTDSLKYDIVLDDYISDPDHSPTDLSWSINVLNQIPVTVGIGGTPKTAKIRAAHLEGDVHIVFTVKDPLGATARDTLTFCCQNTAVDDALAGQPVQFKLFDNYPNPFNPSTTIRYGLPRAGEVNLTVYNLLGQKVETLVDEYRAAGFYEVTWMPETLPSGLYLIVIQCGDWRKVKRMVYTK